MLAGREIDWAAIVGVDQRQVPEFAPLIEVGHARDSELEGELREAVEGAQQGYSIGEATERLDERPGSYRVEDAIDEAFKGRLITQVGINPACLFLAFARRLDRERLHSLDQAPVGTARGPRAD